jgi:hypothetical protein
MDVLYLDCLDIITASFTDSYGINFTDLYHKIGAVCRLVAWESIDEII